MGTFRLRDLYERYAGALAYVAIRDAVGDEHIGSAFHVGEGVFVTARHVVHEQQITEVATTVRSEVSVGALPNEKHEASATIRCVEPHVLQIVEGPFYHDDPSVDVAAFRVAGLDPYAPCVPLGDHLETDVEDHSFVLTDALVLGYPPIPNTNAPRLVATRAEVSAVVDTRYATHAHFVISAMARGGFSGGVVLSEFGHALGMVTESLTKNEAPPELGFMTVLGVEAIYACIGRHFFLKEDIGSMAFAVNTIRRCRLSHVETAKLNPRLAVATVSVYDDDRDVFLEITCHDPASLRAAHAALEQLVPTKIVESQSRSGHLFLLPEDNPSAELLERAARAAVEALIQNGYVILDRDRGFL